MQTGDTELADKPQVLLLATTEAAAGGASETQNPPSERGAQ